MGNNLSPGEESGEPVPPTIPEQRMDIDEGERRETLSPGGMMVPNNNEGPPPPPPVQVEAPPDPDDDYVPTVFRWEHGGRQVYVTGTFNDWQRQIPMHRSGNDFTYIHNLKKGKHAFKFIVDDEWRFAPDQPTVADVEGRINNFIDVSDFDAYVGDDQFLLKRDKSVANDLYARDIPDLDEYTKDPPPLPPHLRHIILNKAPPQGDPNALPVPQHVALNHLYCTAIKDGMMVLGVTLSYKQKHCTTVYYSVS